MEVDILGGYVKDRQLWELGPAIVKSLALDYGCESAADVMVYLPQVNTSQAAATTAALGVLTPMPCLPMTTAPWMPGSPTVLIGGKPALNDSSQLLCSWAGAISINFAGQVTVQIP